MIAKITRLRQPFDISTTDGRTKERYRRALITTLASLFSKFIKILIVIISVPLAINYLGTERYGLWLTMSSLISFLNFADFGIGNGLLNAISEANGKNDHKAAQEYVSSAFFVLSGVAIVLAAIFALSYPWIQWEHFFNVTSEQAKQESGLTIMVFMACFLASIPLGVIQRIQLGYQEGFISNLWDSFGSLLGLGGVLLAIYFEAGLPWLVLAMAGAPVITLMLNGIILLGFRRTWLQPHFRTITKSAVKKILATGSLFFILQIAASILLLSDNIIIAQALGASAVVAFAIPQKIFGLIDMVLDMAVVPLWPAYGEAASRGDIIWIKNTLLKSLLGGFIFTGIASFILVLFGTKLITMWTGSTVEVPFLLLVGFGLWTVIKAMGNIVAMFLNGVGAIQFQTLLAVCMAILVLVAKVFFVHLAGLNGLIFGTIIIYTLCSIIPYAIYIPKKLAVLSSQVDGQLKI